MATPRVPQSAWQPFDPQLGGTLAEYGQHADYSFLTVQSKARCSLLSAEESWNSAFDGMMLLAPGVASRYTR